MNKVSYFYPIQDVIPKKSITVLEVMNLIKSEELKTVTTALREITDKKLASEFKRTKFPAVTFCGEVPKRSDIYISSFTNIVCVDIDDLKLDELKQILLLLAAIKYFFVGYFVSPTGTGIKALIRVPDYKSNPKNIYKAICLFLSDQLKVPLEKFDPTCYNLSRLCFLCYDPNIYISELISLDGDLSNVPLFDVNPWIIKLNQQQEIKGENSRAHNDGTDLNTFSNQYLRGGKLDYNHKDDSKNFGIIISVVVQKYGAYKPGNRNTFIQRLSSIANQFGMSKEELRHQLTSFYNRVVPQTLNEGFDLDKDLLPIVDYTYTHYKDQFATWIETDNSQIETPCLPESVYNNLPWLLKDPCSKFENKRERDVFLLGAIGVLSSAYPRVHGKYRGRWVGMNLYVFIIANAASGKGVLYFAKKLASVISKKLKEAYKNDLEKYEQQLNIFESTPKEERGEKPIKPIKKKYFIAGNSSTSSIIHSLSNNQYWSVLFEMEISTLTSTLNNEGWGDYNDVLRKCFHHEPVSLQRRTNDEDLEIEKTYLSMVLSGTPAQVKSLLNSIENGFFSRIIYYNWTMSVSKWADVFDEKMEPLEEYFDALATRIELTCQPYFQPIADDYSNIIKFDFTESQKQEFNKWFTVKHDQLQHLYGSDIIASVKRLGVIFYRLCMLLSTLRNIEEKEIDLKRLSEEKYIICKDIDYQIAEEIVSTILLHTISIYNQVKGTPKRFGKNIKATFLENLPTSFDRATAMDIALFIGIKSKTAEKYLSDFVEAGDLIKPQHNLYEKNPTKVS